MSINTIIVDNKLSSLELLKNKVVNNQDLSLAGAFSEFASININLNNVDLIIFDVNSKNSDEINKNIAMIKEKYPDILFIATSYEINSELVTKTLNSDVKDFILKPIIDNIFDASIKKIKDAKTNKNQNLSNTICVFSNKGGTGKTSIAVNLAYELSLVSSEDKVCLLDFTVTSSDAATFLNIEPRYNLDNILPNIEHLDEKLLLSLTDCYNDSNLYVFSAINTSELSNKLNMKNALKIINYLKNIFRWIIIDVSDAISETNISILADSDLVLLIGLMNMVSIRNCQRLLELFDRANFNKEKVKYIVNRYIQSSDITPDDIEKVLGKTIFEKIPNNYLTLIDAINVGQPVGEINPQSNIARAYKKLAKSVLNIDYISLSDANRNNYNHGIFNLLRRMGE